jgi:twitching motility protein PilT
VVAAEVMLASDAVRNLIREGRIHHLSQTIAIRRGEGMVTLEASLADLVKRGLVSRELAHGVAYYPDELTQLLG